MAEDDVVKAISTVMDALSPLDAEAREHVLEFVVIEARHSHSQSSSRANTSGCSQFYATAAESGRYASSR